MLEPRKNTASILQKMKPFVCNNNQSKFNLILCMRANMAAKLYSSIILLHFLLVSFIFLPSVCIKLRDKDLNSTNSHLFHVKIPAECAGQTWLNKNLSNTLKRPVVEWRKRGSICVFLPPKDLAECMDVHANPGPPKPQTDSSNLVNLQLQRPHNEDRPHLSLFAACKVYSRQELFALHSQKYHDQEFRTCLRRIKVDRLLRNDLLMRMLHSYKHDFWGGPS